MDRWNKKLTCEDAKSLDLVEYLKGLAILPVKVKGPNFWYLSPFRSEKIPSFKVNRNRNRWYDFGEGCGGSLIDFAIRYNNCTVGEFLNLLSGYPSNANMTVYSPKQFKPDAPGIIYSHDLTLRSLSLLNYLKERRIPISIADQYSREVYYTFPENTRDYFAIGFKNNQGGWELRNSYFKGSIAPKSPTFLSFNNSVICVFEGFVDFLSFLALIPDATTKYDFLILNGLSMFEKARKHMDEYVEVWLFLDRNTSGMKTTTYARSLNARYLDKSSMYLNYVDLNDYLVGKRTT